MPQVSDWLISPPPAPSGSRQDSSRADPLLRIQPDKLIHGKVLLAGDAERPTVEAGVARVGLREGHAHHRLTAAPSTDAIKLILRPEAPNDTRPVGHLGGLEPHITDIGVPRLLLHRQFTEWMRRPERADVPIGSAHGTHGALSAFRFAQDDVAQILIGQHLQHFSCNRFFLLEDDLS